MKLLTTVSNKISLVIAFFGIVCIASMMIIITIDLVSRYFFGSAMTGVIEIMQIMFCVTLYSGLAYCQTRHSHIRVTLFVSKLPGRARFLVWGLASLLGTATGFLVTAASWVQTGIVVDRYSMLLWIPFYPFYLFSTICMFVFSLCMLLDCIRSFVAAFNPQYAEEVAATWSS